MQLTNREQRSICPCPNHHQSCLLAGMSRMQSQRPRAFLNSFCREPNSNAGVYRLNQIYLRKLHIIKAILRRRIVADREMPKQNLHDNHKFCCHFSKSCIQDYCLNGYKDWSAGKDRNVWQTNPALRFSEYVSIEKK